MDDLLQSLVEQGYKVLVVDVQEFDVVVLSSATAEKIGKKQKPSELARIVLLALLAQRVLVKRDPPNLFVSILAQRTLQLRHWMEQERGRAIGPRRLTPKKVGCVVRDELQLHTERDGSSQGRGRYAVVWDEEAIAHLREQFNISEEEISETVALLK